MSDKVTLQTIDSLQNQISALSKLNSNFTVLAEKLDTLLSRDGDTPNQLEANIDMNSYRITNLPAPSAQNEPARLKDIQDIVFGGVVDNTIDTDKLQNDSVTADKLAANSVTTIKIADANVTNAKLSSMAEATFKMRAAGSGTGAPIDGTAAQAKTVLSLPSDTVQSLNEKSPTITDQTAVGTLDTSDELLVWDISDSDFKKTTVNEIASLSSGGIKVSPYIKFGCLPENISGNVERFYKGVITDPGGSPTQSYYLGGASAYLEVDMTVTGAGGRDTGTLASFNDKTTYFFLVINDTDPLQNKMIASLSASASGVTRPTGYTATTPIRLPYAKVYRTSGGFQPHHMKGGQPWSVHLTGWDTGGTWNITGADNTAGTGSYTNADASLWIPNNARLVRFRIKATGSASDGVVYVSTPGILDEKLVASVSYIGDVDVSEFEIRVSSLSVFQIKATVGVTFSCVVVEYTMSDDC